MIPRWKDLSKDYDEKDNFIIKSLVVDSKKKRRVGSQDGSGSLGPEKLLKIINCATIKEAEKLKETMVGVKGELECGHQYRLGSNFHNKFKC